MPKHPTKELLHIASTACLLQTKMAVLLDELVPNELETQTLLPTPEPSHPGTRASCFKLPRRNQSYEAAVVEPKKSVDGHLPAFAANFRKGLREMGETELREDWMHLVDEKKVSRSYPDQAVSTIQFLHD